MKFFNLDAENFSEIQKQLASQLEQLKIDEKDILRTQLLIEETFWRMVNKGHFTQVKIKVRKNFLGKIQVQMTAEGVPYNPLTEVSDWDEDDEDESYFSMMILNANRELISWRRRQNLNVVTINVRTKSNAGTFLTMACIIGGLICGVLMKEFLSPETISLIGKTIIEPCEKMFLDALQLLITPVIFFSVINGMAGMGSGAGVGKIGLKLIGWSVISLVITLILAMGVSYVCFNGGVPPIGEMPVENFAADVAKFSFVQFVVDIIPDNFVSPILDGKILQVIFVAILFGISLNALGEKVSLVKTLVDNLSMMFTKMMSLVIFFVPPIAFFAMISLALGLNLETVEVVAKLVIGQTLVAVLVVAFFQFFILRVGKISPKPFMKQTLTLLPTAFATSSSSAVMPNMVSLCTDKLGVSPKISSFAIPISSTLNLAGTVIYLVPPVVMFVKMYGHELDFENLALIAILASALSFSMPPVPASGVICVVSILSNFGIPGEVAGLMFCLDALSDRITTCVNVFKNMTDTVTLARTENLLDEKIYFRE